MSNYAAKFRTVLRTSQQCQPLRTQNPKHSVSAGWTEWTRMIRKNTTPIRNLQRHRFGLGAAV